MKEATENSVRMPEDDSDAFELLVGWVYDSTIPVNIESWTERNCNCESTYLPTCDRVFQSLLRLHVLAKKMLLERLQNVVTDDVAKIICHHHTMLAAHQYRFVWDTCEPDDGPYQAVLEALAYIILTDGFEYFIGDLAYTELFSRNIGAMKFAVEAMATFPNAKHSYHLLGRKGCKHHVHVDTPECLV